MLRTDQKARRLEQDFKKLQEVENLRLCMVSEWQDEWQAAVQTFRSTHGASEGTSKDVSAELDQHMTQFFGSLRQESVALGKLRRRTELTMIVTALKEANLDLRYGGHYYRCSNGAPVTILWREIPSTTSWKDLPEKPEQHPLLGPGVDRDEDPTFSAAKPSRLPWRDVNLKTNATTFGLHRVREYESAVQTQCRTRSPPQRPDLWPSSAKQIYLKSAQDP
ncbi:hypothetical protein OC861_006985 [Tilletia horrida]|nr:hypothetical protein OC861_006985 [Tilletia horrida]